MSYNVSLKCLFDQHSLNSRQARWLSFLSEYDFETKHIKGKENKMVDALICHADFLYATTSNMYETDLEDKIKSEV